VIDDNVFCEQCGASIAVSTKFCPDCGSSQSGQMKAADPGYQESQQDVHPHPIVSQRSDGPEELFLRQSPLRQSPPCPRCGAEYPHTEFYADGSVFCHREGLIVGRVDVPPRGWYLMLDDPSRQLYWDPSSGWSGPARPAETDTKPFPVERLVTMTPTATARQAPPSKAGGAAPGSGSSGAITLIAMPFILIGALVSGLWRLAGVLAVCAVIAAFIWGGTTEAHARCFVHELGAPGLLNAIACVVEH
jgi:hypothetical protein